MKLQFHKNAPARKICSVYFNEKRLGLELKEPVSIPIVEERLSSRKVKTYKATQSLLIGA